MTDGPAIITVREVYDLVLQVKEKLDGQDVAAMQKDIEDHEQRIRGLERFVWGAAGIGAVGGAVLSQIVTRILA